jgi:serine/threonine protein kinase
VRETTAEGGGGAGTVAGRFALIRKLGEGGMGVVYEAEDLERGARVALKVLHRARAGTVARFKREFRSLQHLEHPNLVRLGELITDGHEWCFTMELVEGVSLLEHVRGERPFAEHTTRGSPGVRRSPRSLHPSPADRFHEGRLRDSLRQLALALATLHAAGIVHRDVKPSNILVTGEGRLIVLDLGLALDLRQEATPSTTGTIVGTVAYMAPEQGNSGRVLASADWYSVGVLLYEALSGRLPHDGDSPLQVLTSKQLTTPPPPRAWWPEAPADLDELCMALLRMDPAARPGEREIFERLGMADALPADRGIAGSSDLTPRLPFVGRRSELAWLEDAFASTSSTALVVHVEGESGLGKSALLRELVDRLVARVPDLLVLGGVCYEREHVPYKALDGVVDRLSRFLRQLADADLAAVLPENTALLARLFPVLEEVDAIAYAPLPRGQVSPRELRARAFEALRELLERLAERHRVVVIIDDMQWTDADSLALLAELLRPPNPSRWLLLLASRPGGTWRRELELALEGPSIASLRLEPLPDGDGAELARLLLDRDLASSAVAVAREASGHPLFIAELCRRTRTTGAGSIELDDAIRARVGALPAATQDVLSLLCVADAPLPPAVVGAAAGIDAVELARHAARLQLAFLTRTTGVSGQPWMVPYHARVSSALLRAMPAERRRDYHTRLAHALTRSSFAREAPELLLHHLAAAGETRSAAEHAMAAARRAIDGLAFDHAADLFAEALRLGEYGADARRDVLLARAGALTLAGRGPEAADAYLAAADGADPAVSLACRRDAAEQLIITGHVGRGLTTLRALLEDIGVPYAPTPRRALFSLLRTRAWLRIRGPGWRPRHASSIAPAVLMELDVLRGSALAFGLIDTIRGADFSARFMLAALGAGEPTRIVPAVCNEAAYIGTAGRRHTRRARRLLRAVQSRLAEPIDALDRLRLEIADAIIDFFDGKFGQAASTLDRSAALMREHAAGTIADYTNAKLFGLFSLGLHGDLTELRARHDESTRDAIRRGDRHLETTTRRASYMVWLAEDDLEGGRGSLQVAGWERPAGDVHLQDVWELFASNDIALYEGRAGEKLAAQAEAIAALRRSLLMRIQLLRSLVWWQSARLRLAVGDRRTAGDIQVLCRRLERDGVRHASAMAGLVRAALATWRHDQRAAVEHLRAVIDHATASEMLLVTACARWRLGELSDVEEGEAARSAARAWMTSHRVARPDKLVDVIAPGFGGASSRTA